MFQRTWPTDCDYRLPVDTPADGHSMVPHLVRRRGKEPCQGLATDFVRCWGA